MKNNLKKALGALKGKVIGKTSDVLSAPARLKYGLRNRTSDSKYKTFKTVNDMRGVPDKGNESDPLFRARATMRLEKMKQREALENN